MSDGLSRLGRKLLDGLQYATVVIGLLVAVVGSGSLLLTGDLVALKWFLFLAGLLSAVIGTLKLRPKSPWKDEQREALRNSYTEDGISACVRELPPVERLDYDRYDYLSDGGRLFLLGILSLLTSFVLEAVFGVGVPQVPGSS